MEEQDQSTPEWQKNVALATNAGGVLAAPGAVYGAYRAAKRNEGGVPRELMRAAGDRESRNPLRRAAARTADFLDAGNKPKWEKKHRYGLKGNAARASRIGAMAAGGGLIGLQLANAGGDFIAARMISAEKKRDAAKRSAAREEVASKMWTGVSKSAGMLDSYERPSADGVGRNLSKAIDYGNVRRPKPERSDAERVAPYALGAGAVGSGAYGLSRFKAINDQLGEAVEGAKGRSVTRVQGSPLKNIREELDAVFRDPAKSKAAQGRYTRSEKTGVGNKHQKATDWKHGPVEGPRRVAEKTQRHAKWLKHGKLGLAGAAVLGAGAAGAHHANQRRLWT